LYCLGVCDPVFLIGVVFHILPSCFKLPISVCSMCWCRKSHNTDTAAYSGWHLASASIFQFRWSALFAVMSPNTDTDCLEHSNFNVLSPRPFSNMVSSITTLCLFESSEILPLSDSQILTVNHVRSRMTSMDHRHCPIS